MFWSVLMLGSTIYAESKMDCSASPAETLVPLWPSFPNADSNYEQSYTAHENTSATCLTYDFFLINRWRIWEWKTIKTNLRLNENNTPRLPSRSSVGDKSCDSQLVLKCTSGLSEGLAIKERTSDLVSLNFLLFLSTTLTNSPNHAIS